MNTPSDTRRLLVGGSSFVGRALMQKWGTGAMGTYFRSPFPGGLAFDPLEDDFEALLDAHGPFHQAFLLFGLTKPDLCAGQPELARRVNVDATHRLLDILSGRNILPVFFSTEVVFDGRRGGYREDDPPNPLMLYGRQKVEIERHVLSLRLPGLVVRLARVMGSTWSDGSLFMETLAGLAAGDTVRAATDIRFSPIALEDVVEAVDRLVAVGASGIVHLAGSRAASRWEMMRLLAVKAREAGLALPGNVVPCTLREIQTMEPRPADISLCIDRLVTLTDFCPRPLADIVACCARSARTFLKTTRTDQDLEARTCN